VSVVWHDLECGAYVEDLPVWRALAASCGDPVLEVGAGTGRVTIELARAGHSVTALDSDEQLLRELAERARGLDVATVVADARSFALGRRFALCVVPMQTIQLLGGTEGRTAFLRCAREHLLDRGAIAIALADQLDLFEVAPGGPSPLPDICEIDGVVYSSRPTAVRAEGDGFELERERQVVTSSGQVSAQIDRIHLDRLDVEQLEREAATAGLSPRGLRQIPATEEHVGTEVVMLGA
jgi:SAM-dependent methyltransferase